MATQYSAHIVLPYDPESGRVIELDISPSTSPKVVADDTKYLKIILPEGAKFTYYKTKIGSRSSSTVISESELIKLVSEEIGEIPKTLFLPTQN